jgi:hypothetical protein
VEAYNVEEQVAQYYIPNWEATAHILFGLHKLGRRPFSEVTQGGRVLGFVFRLSMPPAVRADLEKIFEVAIDLEQFRYEPTGPITAYTEAQAAPAEEPRVQ